MNIIYTLLKYNIQTILLWKLFPSNPISKITSCLFLQNKCKAYNYVWMYIIIISYISFRNLVLVLNLDNIFSMLLNYRNNSRYKLYFGFKMLDVNKVKKRTQHFICFTNWLKNLFNNKCCHRDVTKNFLHSEIILFYN